MDVHSNNKHWTYLKTVISKNMKLYNTNEMKELERQLNIVKDG